MWLQLHHSWKGALTPPLTPLSLGLQHTAANHEFDNPIATGHWPLVVARASPLLEGLMHTSTYAPSLQLQHTPANLDFANTLATGH
jgi:hypothetical protein